MAEGHASNQERPCLSCRARVHTGLPCWSAVHSQCASSRTRCSVSPRPARPPGCALKRTELGGFNSSECSALKCGTWRQVPALHAEGANASQARIAGRHGHWLQTVAPNGPEMPGLCVPHQSCSQACLPGCHLGHWRFRREFATPCRIGSCHAQQWHELVR